MIVSVFVRRLNEGRTFAEFVAEWEADEGFGVPTRGFSAQSLEDPRDVISIGFVDLDAAELAERLTEVAAQERVRHDRIETVVEATTRDRSPTASTAWQIRSATTSGCST